MHLNLHNDTSLVSCRDLIKDQTLLLQIQGCGRLLVTSTNVNSYFSDVYAKSLVIILLKNIFCASITTCTQPTSICDDLLSVLHKYNLHVHIEKYIKEGVFPSKYEWRKIVNTSVHSCEEYRWVMQTSINANMTLYARVHCKLNYHILWQLAYLHPTYKSALQICIKISSRGKISKECNLCNRYTCDYDFHILLHCEGLHIERNNFLRL